MYMSIAVGIPSMFTMPLLGAFSDIVGRNILIVFSVISKIARVVVFMLALFFHRPLWIMLVWEDIYGVLGNYS